jgi:fructokinase
LSQKTGRIKNANSTVLNGKALDRDLSARLGRPIRLENDANCFALSEAVDGAARHCEAVFGVILGTGVGVGLVIRKEVLTGHNRIAGEWGHNPLPWPRDDERPGRRCYCGKDGCIETFLSGPALARQYKSLTGQTLTARRVSEAAQEGDAAAAECLSIYEDRLARSLASVVNVVDPDAIVLGGGLSNMKRLYVNLRPSIERFVFSDSFSTKILQAAHGDSSGVRGAAWLWPVSS